MTVEEVRAGMLTPEDRESSEADIPLEKMKKADLVKIAKELNFEFDEEVVTRGDLILEIKGRQAK